MTVQTRTRRRVVPVAVAVAALFAAGCGGQAKVKGTVTLDGKPVVWGTVTLVDSTGMYHQGHIDLQGQYEIPNVPKGTVKIAVHSTNPDAGTRGGRDNKAPGKGQDKGAGADDPREKFLAEKGVKKAVDDRPRPPAGAWVPIPPNYRDADKSGLTATVGGGENVVDIKLSN